jgi:hypothetical protein
MVAGPLGKVVEKRESRGRWWVGWMDIFDDVRQVSVSKAVCSYHGAQSFVFVPSIHVEELNEESQFAGVVV